MRPIKIDGADPKPLDAPPDWDAEKDGHCQALFVRRELSGGVAYMRSGWEVEASEAMFLFAGAHLMLGVSGDCHPVIQMGIDTLPADFEPVVFARPCVDNSGQPCVRVEMLFPHENGKRAFIVVLRAGRSIADSVAEGIVKIEELARRERWIQ